MYRSTQYEDFYELEWCLEEYTIGQTHADAISINVQHHRQPTGQTPDLQAAGKTRGRFDCSLPLRCYPDSRSASAGFAAASSIQVRVMWQPR